MSKPNRKQRRQESFGKPTVSPPAPATPKLSSLKMEAKDYVLLCLALAMWLIPLPSGQETTVFVARFVLVGISLVRPVLHLPWVAHAETRRHRWIVGSLCLLALAGLIGLVMKGEWPPVHRHTFSQEERKKFEKPLMELKQPKTSIHLYCAPEDEVDCEYAADLIPLFGEAGWDVSGVVERVTLGRPQPGIIIAVHGTLKPEDELKLKWNQGEWAQWTPEEEHVRQAFTNIGIEPDSTSGYVIPENQINIYVGHEREDESVPTGMSRTAETMQRARREHPQMPKVSGAK
jgi:hypothetical protein